jgi:hypothetical protein
MGNSNMVIYVFFTSIVLVCDTISNKNENKFKKLVVNNMKFTTVIALYLNFYSLNFWLEMLFVPITCLLIMIQVYTEKKEGKNENNVHKFVSTFLGMIWISILIYCIYRTFQNIQSILSKEFIESLLFPIILTILYMPYLYSLSIYSEYDSWFTDLPFRTQGGKGEEYYFRKKLIFRYCGINLSKIRFISRNFHIYTMLSKEKFETELQEWNNKYKHRLETSTIQE